MANIHRLGDYSNNNQNNNYGRPPPSFGGDQRANDAFASQPLLGGMRNQQYVDPRKETFCQMLKFTFCPTFTIKSFIFFITAVDVLMYLLTLFITIFDDQYKLDPYNFLGPSTPLLIKFGAKDPYKLRYDAELWRLVTPLILHASFLHILMNCISQMIIGFMLESLMGPLRVAALYIVAGIGGEIFACLCSPHTTSVGASTAIFGLFAGWLALVIVNWIAMERQPELRCCLIVFIVIILLFSMLFSAGTTTPGSTQQVDIYGHLGGFLAGLFFGLVVQIWMRGQQAHAGVSYEKKCRYVGIGLTGIFFILCFTLFYTVVHP